MRIKLLLGLSLLVMTSCRDQSYETSKQQRVQHAIEATNKQPIVIGVPWRSEEADFFIAGVKLAVKEINQKGGVLDHVPLQIKINNSESVFYDRFFPTEMRRTAILNIARDYAANPNLIAVVGHSSSETSMIASVVYENRGIVFLAPGARHKKLTGHNFKYTFRTSLNNTIMGEQVAEYVVQKGYKRVAILSDRSDSTEEFINEFTTHAIEGSATEIVYRRSFFEHNVDIISLISELKNIQKMDVILIATGHEKAAKIYQQIRNVGIKLPIIGNSTLDTKDFWQRIKQWEYGNKIQKSAIPTLFNVSTVKGKQFDVSFSKEYHQEADYLAALGYDSINLLAHAIQYSKSRVPLEIATTLRYMKACKGVTGQYEFDNDGDLKSKPVSFYHLVKNDYVFERVKNEMLLDDPYVDFCNEIDRDHDGIPTESDECPDTTKIEIAKGVYQDGAERGCPIDTDKDGIPDYKDACFNDSIAAISKGVDVKGCPVDFDKDKIPDYKDADVDGDKVLNKEDTCPKTTPQELIYGVNLTGKQKGCPIDTDVDTMLDYRDACRKNTALEISQGIDKAGCPVDVDTDKVLDYQDKCLKTAADILVDAQGCDALFPTVTPVSESLLFDAKEVELTFAGKKQLDKLLAQSDLTLLKKIELIGYTNTTDKIILENRLTSIVAYFQQQKTPVEKIITNVMDKVAKKDRKIDFIFSQVKTKSSENTTPPVENPAQPTISIPTKQPKP